MKVPTDNTRCEIEVNRSRFVAIACGFERSESIKERVDSVRGDFPGCSHVAYAFVVGDGADEFGMSDDREPRGTAGRPMLEVIKGSGVTNVLVTVVRFFGGTKLGTGGLARAYSGACKCALESLGTEELVRRKRFTLSIDYAAYGGFKAAAKQFGIVVGAQEFGTRVVIDAEVPETNVREFDAMVSDLSRGADRPRYLPT